MTRFQYINENIDRIRKDVSAGIFPISLLTHYVIYSRFDLYKKQGNNINKSVFFASQDFKVTDDCVYKIKKSMEEDI
jgi:hypothetical protein